MAVIAYQVPPENVVGLAFLGDGDRGVAMKRCKMTAIVT